MHRMAIPTTKNLYLKFNNYFQTDEDIDNVIEKLKIPNKNDKLFNFKYTEVFNLKMISYFTLLIT